MIVIDKAKLIYWDKLFCNSRGILRAAADFYPFNQFSRDSHAGRTKAILQIVLDKVMDGGISKYNRRGEGQEIFSMKQSRYSFITCHSHF